MVWLQQLKALQQLWPHQVTICAIKDNQAAVPPMRKDAKILAKSGACLDAQ